MDNITEEDYENSLKVIQKYYRQITGKKESLTFYVNYIQPIRKYINNLKNYH